MAMKKWWEKWFLSLGNIDWQFIETPHRDERNLKKTFIHCEFIFQILKFYDNDDKISI